MLTASLAAVAISKIVLVPLLPGFTESQVCGLSSDGKTVVGFQTAGDKKVAFIWDEKKGARNLGEFSWNMWRAGMNSIEFDENGNAVDRIGLKPGQMRWARTVAFMGGPKADLKPFRTPWVFGASADGKVLFGNGIGKSGSEGFVWSKAGGAVGIGDLAGGFFYSQLAGISPDGKWAVGCSKSFDGLTAAIWSKAAGIGALRFKNQGKAMSRALCASVDAKTVGGEAETTKGLEAVVWFSRGDGEFVRTLAGDKMPSGWLPASVECVSDGGTTIAGTATKDGKSRAWIASISVR